MSSDSSAVDRSRDVPPWKISFSPLVTFVGCAVTAVLFAVLLYAWLALVVPDDVFTDASSPARITAVIALLAAPLLLMLGPFVALGVGRLLRRSGSTAVHVIAFTFTGSLVGFLGGALLGPDVAASMLVTLGLAAGITRLALTPFARRRYNPA